MSVIVYQFQTVKFIQMMSLTFGLFTQVSGSGPLGPLVTLIDFTFFLTVFQSYQDEVWVKMKGCVQFKSVYD